MVDDEITENTGSGEDDKFSIEATIAFQGRMETNPDSVSDKEIEAQYGTDFPPNELRDLFRKNTFGRSAKNPRTSARAKLRRRLLWLSRSLEEVEFAAAAVSKAPGRTNKQGELDNLLAAIKVFRDAMSLPISKEPVNADPDIFERMFGTARHDRRPIPVDQKGDDEDGLNEGAIE